jgi:tetratricopeptide (TPR) repeat protein
MASAIVEEGFEEVRPLANLVLASLSCVTKAFPFPELERFLISEEELAALGDPFLQGTWSWFLGCVHTWWGHPDDALRVLRNVPEAATHVMTNRLWNWWTKAVALGTKGEYEVALRLLEDTVRTCERVDDVPVRARALNTVGWIYGELQDHGRALEWNRASLEFAQSHPDFPEPDIQMNARLNMADDLVALGRREDAEEQFRTVEAVAEGPLPDAFAFWRYAQRLYHSYGELWLARGDLARAAGYADRCLELALGNSSRKNVVKGRRLRAQVLIGQGRLKEAEDELSAALEVAQEVGNPPQLWKTHAAIGDLHRAHSRSEEARHAHAEALSIIETVAESLGDQHLRATFLESEHIQGIRRAAADLG